MTTQRTEEYLETIYKLEERGERPTVGSIAAHLTISAASVSEMLKKLQSDGLLTGGSRSVGFTEEGKSIALKVVRRHRLSERLLTDMLGLDWTDSHDKACDLEHVLDKDMEDRIEKNLGYPKTCPHGYPIPSSDGTVEHLGSKRLSDLEKGTSGEVSSVPEEDVAALDHLNMIGIRPSSTIESLGDVPFSDTIRFNVDGVEISLSRSLAHQIRIK